MTAVGKLRDPSDAAVAALVRRLDAKVKDLEGGIEDLTAKLQYLVDHFSWDGGVQGDCESVKYTSFTFPDGTTYYVTGHEPTPKEHP